MALRINPRLGMFARQMRQEPTPFEQALWSRLRASRLDVLKFRHQTVIDDAIADFFLPSVGLIVEVDGDTHDAAKDAARDRRLARKGFTVLRFTNAEVGGNIEGVLQTILLKARSLPPRFTRPPTPVWQQSCPPDRTKGRHTLEREGEEC